ncbi:hypothetical protein SMC26_41005 [Actinomadura fulvescens]|uniref:hypothetical protein n=1 Tax=Actinomadura fulvescens TaxID=46160 RepID=UPI0031D2DAFA
MYRPEVYGAWLNVEGLDEAQLREARAAASTTLANALKPYGVATRQINRRGAGGGAKGIRLEDLPILLEAPLEG